VPAPERPGLVKLWSYSCDDVAGLNVSAMVWNKLSESCGLGERMYSMRHGAWSDSMGAG